MVSNLVNNSAKYTPAGGSVAVSASMIEGGAEICVRDDGIGIAAELLPKVFDMFMQVAAADRPHHSGLGIGLALVKQFVDRHGGTVRVDSAGLGQGCSVRVMLPRI